MVFTKQTRFIIDCYHWWIEFWFILVEFARRSEDSISVLSELLTELIPGQVCSIRLSYFFYSSIPYIHPSFNPSFILFIYLFNPYIYPSFNHPLFIHLPLAFILYLIILSSFFLFIHPFLTLILQSTILSSFLFIQLSLAFIFQSTILSACIHPSINHPFILLFIYSFIPCIHPSFNPPFILFI